MIDNTTNNKTLNLSGQFNVWGNMTIPVGTTLNLNPGTGNTFTIELVKSASSAVNYNETYTATLADVAFGGSIVLNGTTLSPGVIAQSNYVLSAPGYAIDPNYSLAVTSDINGSHLVLTFTPVPEPATVFALAAAGLGLGGLVRRRLRRA